MSLACFEGNASSEMSCAIHKISFKFRSFEKVIKYNNLVDCFLFVD